MNQSASHKSFVYLLITCFLLSLILIPSDVHARWVSEYDDLPGMSTGEFVTLAVVCAGVVIAVYLISKHSKKKSDSDKTKEQAEIQTPTDSLQSFSSNGNFNKQAVFNLKTTSKNDYKIVPILGMKSLTNNGLKSLNSGNLMRNNAVMVGLSVRF